MIFENSSAMSVFEPSTFAPTMVVPFCEMIGRPDSTAEGGVVGLCPAQLHVRGGAERIVDRQRAAGDAVIRERRGAGNRRGEIDRGRKKAVRDGAFVPAVTAAGVAGLLGRF